MSDGKSGGIPWTSLAVLAAFVGSTQLVPQAFEQLRPAEKERAQSSLSAEMEVDARLWEDPFAALRRYELERSERCDRVTKSADRAVCRNWEGSRRPEVLRDRLDRDGDKDISESLVVLALVPGNPFVGAEEGRRRTRYAVLAGLQAQGYVPDNAERLGLLEFDVQRLTNDCEAARAARRPAGVFAADAAASGAALTVDLANEPPVCKEAGRPGASLKPSEKAKFTVPYEMLAKRNRHREADTTGPQRRFEQVALLWVDESSLPDSKLDGLARMLDAMLGPELVASRAPCVKPSRTVPQLAIIGPSSTDALRTALSDLRRASEVYAKDSRPVFEAFGDKAAACDCKNAASSAALGAAREERELDGDAAATRAPELLTLAKPKGEAARVCPLLADPRPALQGYRLLAGSKIFNAASTASNNMLDELRKQDLDAFLNEKFNRMLGDRPPLKIDFQRTISTDNELIKRLVAELQLRLPAHEARRVVVVAERDSIYSQSLVNELQHRLKEFGKLSFEPVYFFRGIDGVTTRDAAGREGNDRDAKANGGSTALEWPESRDQLDYLRRLATTLKASEAPGNGGPIGAIGILASDVHDKLLVMQALHGTFSDKVFFTTDMDARFLHPRVQAFTRNLIVATSLPLEFYPPREGQVNLQAGTPPLRDVYQTASYLAARRAGCRSLECMAEEKLAAKDALDKPSLYEIGRNGAVPLSGYALLAQAPRSGSTRLIVAALGAAVLVLALLVWPSTPAIKQARTAYLRRPLAADAMPMNLPTVVLVALHAALCAFAFCSLIELVWPQQMSFAQTLLLSALAAFAALMAVLPSLLAQQRNAVAGVAEQESGVDKMHIAILVLIASAWVWLAWPGQGGGVCLDCEPVTWLQGVSAWPSQLLHLLALMAILWTLDVAWSGTLARMNQDSVWLRLPPGRDPGVSRIAVQGMVKGWFNQISISSWRRPCGVSSDFVSLWAQFGARGDSRPRAARTIVWYLLSVLVVTALFFGLSEGQVPEIPVRGLEHRQLVRITLYATLLLLPLLVVAVADATLLAFRFIGHLNCGRSAYPQVTIAHFAAQLGQQHAPLWQRMFPANLESRLQGADADSTKGGRQPGAIHCLLDDWLDVQVVARCTEYVSRLVIGPFVVLALLVVARSRLFDNWSLTPAIAVAISLYLIWLIGLASLLKIAAEKTRKRALASMNADLRWLAGSDAEWSVLVEPFKRLIASVEGNQTGAFAPMFEQPLLKALLVPLGGAGGAQLFDYLLLAR